MGFVKTWIRKYKFKQALKLLAKSEERLEKARKKRKEIEDGKLPWWY